MRITEACYTTCGFQASRPGLIWNGEFLALSGIRICRWFVEILHFEMHWTNSSFPGFAGKKINKSLGAFVKYADFPAFPLETLIQKSIFSSILGDSYHQEMLGEIG